MVTDKKKLIQSSIRPLQSLTYAEKIKDDYLWYKQNADYYINQSQLSTVPSTKDKNRYTTYNAYNNLIDVKEFEYVTNPLNSDNELYKQFPARLRSYNIIRPNIDLLMGEWNKKPFKYDVLNMDGDEVFNAFQANQTATFKAVTEQLVVNELNKIQQTILPTIEVPDPKTVITNLNATFKDAKAINGHRALKSLEYDINLKQIFKKLFKDWCLDGTVQTLKFVNHSNIDYSRLTPMWTATENSDKNFEDNEWGVTKLKASVSDVVEMFYDSLSEKNLKDLEAQNQYGKAGMFNVLSRNITKNDGKPAEGITNNVDIYFVNWKSRRKIGLLKYRNPLTNEPETTEVDEAYKPEEGEEIEWIWINESTITWRLNENIYLEMGPSPIQRNDFGNLAECKLSINGKRFSDTESENVSLVELGMPYQIMYIILMYRVELAIARSKGKIHIVDQNIIPDFHEGGEEKFFYQGEALGYVLADYNQEGVARGLNGSPSMDFNQFDFIKQLIDLAHFFKSEWEELIGITRQRKGQNNSSDGLGVTEAAIFRSSVISDIVFSSFDEFIQSELQGLLDLTKYAWIDVKTSYYKNDDGSLELFKLDPTDHANSAYKVYVDSMGRTADKLEQLKAQINAIAQRKDVKLSSLADLIFLDSYAEIKAKLKQAEEIEAKLIQAQAKDEQEQEVLKIQLQKEYEEFRSLLTINENEAEADRLDNREYIKGQVEAMKQSPEKGINIEQIEKQANERLKIQSDERKATFDRISKEKIEIMKDLTSRLKIASDIQKEKIKLKNPVAGEKK